MKHLGNVLYITTPEVFLTLDGENIVVKKEDEQGANVSTRLPLHNLDHIICFTWQGASPALMGVRRTKYRADLSHAKRKVSRTGHGSGEGECPAEEETI